MATMSKVADWIGVSAPLLDVEITEVSSIEAACESSVVFAVDGETLKKALRSKAGVILASRRLELDGLPLDPRVLWVEDARYAFAVVARRLRGVAVRMGVHASAVVGKGVTIGVGTAVGPGVVIGDGVTIGSECEIGPRVTVYAGTVIGDRVVVQAGAVLGATGFGYVRNAETGEYLLFPQQGTLVIEDDVEIGANTTIDRGALGESRIGAGTKIDNQVHIAHNCRIGKNVVIAAQVGISGSCTVGDGVVMAGQVGLGDHVTIGPGVILGGACGVFPHKTVEGPGQMFMGVPAEPLKDYLKNIAKVRRLK